MVDRTRASQVDVLIPWRGDCPHRAAALNYVTKRWTELGFRCVLGVPDGERWCKAIAVQRAYDASDANVIIVADADVWCPDGIEPMLNALFNEGASWAVPHRLVHRLDEEATTLVLEGTEPNPSMGLAVLNKPYEGRLGGGIVGLPAWVWEECPLDANFLGWGHEDEAWALALEHLYGRPHRHNATLWHLWHPPQQRISWGLGSAESDELYKRYHLAKTNRDRSEMRSLLDEGRPARAFKG